MGEDSFREYVDYGRFDYLLGALDSHVNDFAEHWKEDYLRYRADSENDSALAQALTQAADEWAKDILDVAEELSFPSALQDTSVMGRIFKELGREMRGAEYANLLKEVGELSTTITPVALRFLRDGIEHSEERAKRCLELLDMAIEGEPTAQVAKYLSRISRCYIWGFYPECLIMCRSALETALSDRLNRTAVKSEGRGDIEGNINRAYTLQILDAEAKKHAHTIRLRGSKAVHDDPDVTKDIRGTVEMTMAVLRQLCRE